MGFVTPALLGGAALVALPIVLHLIMRREAQQLKFPALRFVQQRRMMNQHRLRLRQLLLLALRCAIIALLAFALARPTLRGSAAAGKEGAADGRGAGVRQFAADAVRAGKPDAAGRRRKSWPVGSCEQLPADSPVTVVDRAGRQRGQDLNRDAAEMRIERLELSAAVRPMEDALRDATRLAGDARTIFAAKSMCSPTWRPRPGRKRRWRRLPNRSTSCRARMCT